MLRNCCPGTRKQGVIDWFWTKQAYDNNTSGRFVKPLVHMMEEVGGAWTQQIPLWVFLIIEEWTILTEGAWKKRNPEERHFEGLISPGRTTLEVGLGGKKWVSGYLKMSSQDDGGYASVTERPMENARKETPYTELGFGTPVAPEVRQVQRGGIQVGGAANLKGSCHSGASAILAMWDCTFPVTRSPIFARGARNSDLLSEIS